MNKFLIYILFAVAFVSCSPAINSDSKPPVIENLEIVNSDVDIIGFPEKSKVKFSANFIDNQELGSYKFDIHFAGDGHKHGYIDTKKAASVGEWDFTRNGKLSGTEHKISFTKTIDEGSTAGPYHCLVYAVDAAGNSAKFVQSRFLVTNEDMPTYTITNPDFTDYKIAPGEIMNLQGIARGILGLSKLAYIIRSIDDFDEDDLLNNSELVSGTVKEVSIDVPITIPTTAKAGKYALILLASDKLSNVGEYFETFEIAGTN